MYKIFHHDCSHDMAQSGDPVLVRKPMDFSTGKESKTCKYAFFPGCRLCGAEPEIVVKAYDSILFQHPDTAIFIQSCNADDIRAQWESLGKPVIVIPCMTCMDNLKANLPEASVISLYELLLEMNVSGGCNSVDYSIFDPDAKQPLDNIRSAVAELAESMGVTLHDDENSEYPYITYCMDCRDSLKNQGKDAVHILELIFGMGASNTHMIHEHDHDHDESDVSIEHDPDETHECDGNCSSCELDCGGNIPTESAPLPTEDERHANRLELKSVLLQLYWNEN